MVKEAQQGGLGLGCTSLASHMAKNFNVLDVRLFWFFLGDPDTRLVFIYLQSLDTRRNF